MYAYCFDAAFKEMTMNISTYNKFPIRWRQNEIMFGINSINKWWHPLQKRFRKRVKFEFYFMAAIWNWLDCFAKEDCDELFSCC